MVEERSGVLETSGDEEGPDVLRSNGDRSTMGSAGPVLNRAVKFDNDKPRYDLVPTYGIESAAKVFSFGAAKYGDRNWEQGLPFGRLYAALQRHLNAFWAGENLDPESGESHLGHAMCCLLMLSELHLNPNYRAYMGKGAPVAQDGSELDDRPFGD